ncbi:MAG: endonuclease/exonuclease/phosphatase family protein [Verrucomicrobia bacterium]|nr:endonuclease/exonuclease/phosphatase family protein [Verrucomicrobiota bacterium]
MAAGTLWRIGAALAAGFLASPVRAASLVVATYNVENYGPANRLTDDGYREDYPKPESEKRALRQVIRAVNADVLVLQEIGGPAYLEELRRDLRAEGLDYPESAVVEAADDDRKLAVLARGRLKAVVAHRDLTLAYRGGRVPVKRGLLELTVEVGGVDVTIFGLHLKSRFTDFADDPQSAARRTGEAAAVRDRVLARSPDPAAARFLILGDCNDGRASQPLRRLMRRGATKLAMVLPAADSRGETWTHCWAREETYSHVDHVLVSPGLRSAVRGGAARIFDGPGVREASDHRPVVVTLDLGK